MNSESWKIDPKTGDYVMDKGSPVPETSLKNPAYYRLRIQRTKWMYAPNKEYGSDLHLIKKRVTNGNNRVVEEAAARALKPIVDDNRASNITINTTVATRSAVGMEIKLTDKSGETQELVINPLGV